MSETPKRVSNTNFGTLGRIAKDKLSSDNDIKVIIQGANSQTGIGKTTLAIHLCRFIDDDWKAEEKAFIDVQKYLNAFLDYSKGSALLLDEIEHGADSRRASSHENVNLSQGWAKLRARNMATVATLPSTSMLDKRMLELADYWILVKKRGIAQPYHIEVNDFRPKRMPQRKPFQGDEHIRFADLPDKDPDKKYLDQIKDKAVRGDELEQIPKPEHDRKIEQAKSDAKEDRRNELIRDVYHKTELSQYDIADLDSIDISRDRVGQIVRDS